MKISILDAKTFGDDADLSVFETLGTIQTYQTTTYEQTLSHIGDSSIVITNKVIIDKHIMDNSSLKLICVAATGMNNIDLEYAKQKGITVKNVVGYSTASVAQLTFALALEFIQQIPYYNNYTSSKQWSKSDIFTHLDKPFFELDNKTWGIIGLGNIGAKVANIASSFGCNVQYYSTSGVNTNTQYKNISLEELLKTSDIISIHCALNDVTNNLINSKNLTIIKDEAIILNLGRGGIVNEDDISKELDSNKLYYGTDVITKEPILENNPLMNVKNKDRLIITPHIAWASKEARTRLIDNIKDNISNFTL
jgi:glycerate dehydrogenase